MGIKRKKETEMSVLENKLELAIQTAEQHRAEGTLTRQDSIEITKIENKMWDLAKEQYIIPADTSNNPYTIELMMEVTSQMAEDFVSRTDTNANPQSVNFYIHLFYHQAEPVVEIVMERRGRPDTPVPLNYMERMAYTDTIIKELELNMPLPSKEKAPSDKSER